jgi:hypothetical protein
MSTNIGQLDKQRVFRQAAQLWTVLVVLRTRIRKGALFDGTGSTRDWIDTRIR